MEIESQLKEGGSIKCMLKTNLSVTLLDHYQLPVWHGAVYLHRFPQWCVSPSHGDLHMC